jgi:hypothetical protein
VRRSSGGATTVIRSAEEIWTVEDFHVQEEAGGAHKKDGSEPLDLERNTRQLSDRLEAARGLSL